MNQKNPTVSEEESNSAKCHFFGYLSPSGLQDNSRPQRRPRQEYLSEASGGPISSKLKAKMSHRSEVYSTWLPL